MASISAPRPSNPSAPPTFARLSSNGADGLLAELTQPDYLALARIVIAEKSRLPEVGELFRASVPERALGHLQHLLGQAQRAGLVREVDPAAAARLFAGPLIVHLLMNHLLTDPDERRPFGRFDMSVHIDLFLAAVRQEPQGRSTA
jgi:TetR/AcrR family transcriptional regulator, mexJK operon transcriptional repressor